MTYRERIRSPSARALRNAGPPNWDVLAGAIISAILVAAGWWTGILQPLPWSAWMAIPVLVLTAIGLADGDGWRIRRAMAYVAIRQRERWTRGRIPATPSLARPWLLDPANADASPLDRASVLFAAGDPAAAGAALDGFEPTTPREVAGLTRMRAVFKARESGTVDMDPIRAATAALDPDERRYQLTAAAFSQAWLDVAAGRPWRARFAAEARELGPHRVPPRIGAMIAIQELAAPVAIVLATAIMSLVSGW